MSTHKCQSSNHGPDKITLDSPPSNINSILDPLPARVLIPLDPGERHNRLQRRHPGAHVDGVEPSPLAGHRLPDPDHIRHDAQVGRDADATAAALGRQRGDLVGPPRDDAHPRAAAGVLPRDGVAHAARRAEDEDALCRGEFSATGRYAAQEVDCWDGEG